MNGKMNSGTIVEHLGIKITEVGDDYLTGTMPADARTFQPYGVVHGGANVVLAETLGSIAGAHVIDFATTKCLGQEVSASHLRPVSSGWSLVPRDRFTWVAARISGRSAWKMIAAN